MLDVTLPLQISVGIVLAAGVVTCAGLLQLRLLNGRWGRLYFVSSSLFAAISGLMLVVVFENGVGLSTAVVVSISAGMLAIFTDLAERKSPDIAPLTIGVSGLFVAQQSLALGEAVLACAIAVMILLFARVVTSARLGKTSGLGDGDVLMAGALGFWLEPALVPIALLASVMLALATAGFTALTSQQALSRQLIPFIPGLCLGFSGVAVLGGAFR